LARLFRYVRALLLNLMPVLVAVKSPRFMVVRARVAMAPLT